MSTLRSMRRAHCATDAAVSAPTEGSRASASAPPTIALVGPLPPPSGGMANQTLQLARLLENEGWRVRIVQANRRCRPEWLERIPYLRALVRLPGYVLRVAIALSGADVAHVMANSGLAWHLCAAPAIWIGRLKRVPVVVNYRGGNANAFLERQAALVRPTLARAAALIVPSGFLRDVFARHAIGADIVPNVVDLAAFAPRDSLPDRLHLVVTRNLEAIYDVGTAIRALAIVRRTEVDATMAIAGSGPERTALEGLARALGIASAVTFTGRLDHAQVPALYAHATVLVNPARIDNMPNSLLEAMAAGVPIVSTNVGGVPYLVVDGETALLVPPGDPEAMATAVLRLHREPGLAERLRSAGIAHATNFVWPRVREQLFNVYRAALVRSARTS